MSKSIGSLTFNYSLFLRNYLITHFYFKAHIYQISHQDQESTQIDDNVESNSVRTGNSNN